MRRLSSMETPNACRASGNSIRWIATLACFAGCFAGVDREARLAHDANVLAAGLAQGGAPALGPGELRVRLVFGEGADLDLYVTDPRQETVYFANNPTRSGGSLEADVRCGAPTPRVETVTFRPALPGRYRVGVDFPERCGERGPDRVAYVVMLEHAGVRREQRGAIGLREFRPIVIEADVPARPSP